MKIFISWATDDGDVSKTFATALSRWLRRVIQALDPWVSVDDLTPGRRWNNDIQRELNETAVGIFCLTKDGQHSQWLSFEAGALAKSVQDENYVIPILIKMRPTDLKGPLQAFQSLSTSRDDMFKLVSTINRALGSGASRPLEPDFLQGSFDAVWGDLEQAIANLPQPSGSQPQSQNTSVQNFSSDAAFSRLLDTYDEMIKLARDTNNAVNQLLTPSGGGVTRRRISYTPTLASLNDVLRPDTEVNQFALTRTEEGADVDDFIEKLALRGGLDRKNVHVTKFFSGNVDAGFSVKITGDKPPILRTVEQTAAATGFSIHLIQLASA